MAALGSPKEEREQKAVDLVQRIQAGDVDAEGELFREYHRGVLIILQQRTRDSALAEDLAQDTILTVLKRLRDVGIDDPRYLNRFIQQTAKYLHISWLRKSVNQTEYRESVDEDVSDEWSPENEIEREELRSLIRELLEQVTVERDREILIRYYVRDQEKAAICDALGLTSDHFDKVINRARTRFGQRVHRNLTDD